MQPYCQPQHYDLFFAVANICNLIYHNSDLHKFTITSVACSETDKHMLCCSDLQVC